MKTLVALGCLAALTVGAVLERRWNRAEQRRAVDACTPWTMFSALHFTGARSVGVERRGPDGHVFEERVLIGLPHDHTGFDRDDSERAAEEEARRLNNERELD